MSFNRSASQRPIVGPMLAGALMGVWTIVLPVPGGASPAFSQAGASGTPALSRELLLSGAYARLLAEEEAAASPHRWSSIGREQAASVAAPEPAVPGVAEPARDLPTPNRRPSEPAGDVAGPDPALGPGLIATARDSYRRYGLEVHDLLDGLESPPVEVLGPVVDRLVSTFVQASPRLLRRPDELARGEAEEVLSVNHLTRLVPDEPAAAPAPGTATEAVREVAGAFLSSPWLYLVIALLVLGRFLHMLLRRPVAGDG